MIPPLVIRLVPAIFLLQDQAEIEEVFRTAQVDHSMVLQHKTTVLQEKNAIRNMGRVLMPAGDDMRTAGAPFVQMGVIQAVLDCYRTGAQVRSHPRLDGVVLKKSSMEGAERFSIPVWKVSPGAFYAFFGCATGSLALERNRARGPRWVWSSQNFR